MPTELAQVEQPANLQAFAVYLNLFAAVQFLAFMGSIMTLIAARFSTVTRQATWYNFIVSILVFSASFLLLFFSGQMYDPQPSYVVCLVQSSLTYAATPFAAATTFGLVVQLYLNIHGAIAGRAPSHTEKYWVLAIIILPYLIYTAVLLESFGIALSNKSQTFSAISYCTLKNNIPGRVTTAIFILLAIPSLILIVLIYKALHRNSVNMQNARQYRAMFIRIAVFLGLGVIAIATGITFFFLVFTANYELSLARLNIVLASIGLIGILIFGSQRDLLEFWLFWRWFRRPATYVHHQSQQPSNSTNNQGSQISPSNTHKSSTSKEGFNYVPESRTEVVSVLDISQKV